MDPDAMDAVTSPVVVAPGPWTEDEEDLDEVDEPYLAPEDVDVTDRPEFDWDAEATANDWRLQARKRELKASVRADLVNGTPAPEGFRPGAAPDEADAIRAGVNVNRLRRAVKRWGALARPYQVAERWCAGLRRGATCERLDALRPLVPRHPEEDRRTAVGGKSRKTAGEGRVDRIGHLAGTMRNFP